jgi:hypothetical protein
VDLFPAPVFPAYPASLLMPIATVNGDLVAIAFVNENATVAQADNVDVEAFGALGGTVTAAGTVTAESALTGTINISAGSSATVTGASDLTVSGHAGVDGSGLGFEIVAVGNVAADASSVGYVYVSSGGNVSGSAKSTGIGYDVNVIAGGASSINASSTSGNASVISLGPISGEISATQGTAQGSSYGLAESVTITGGQEADLAALGGGDATVDSTAGDVQVFSGGSITLTSEAYTNLSVCSNGSAAIEGVADTGWIEAVSAADLDGSLNSKLGTVNALAVGTANLTVLSGTDTVLFGGAEVIGVVLAGNDLEVASYGEISGGFTAIHDLWVSGGGLVAGIYTAYNSVQSFSSDGSIEGAVIVAGFGPATGQPGFGVIGSVSAWGNISGSITAAVGIEGITAGGTVTANVSVPAGQTVGIDQGDSVLIGTLPVMGDIGQAALGAAVRGMITEGLQIQVQFTQQIVLIQQQLAASKASATQEYAADTAQFNTDSAQATQTLATFDATTNFQLAQAEASDHQILAIAGQQIGKVVQQIQSQANAAKGSDLASIQWAEASIAAAQQQAQAEIATLATIKAGFAQTTATAIAGMKSTLAAGKAQHEADWKITMDRTMHALNNQSGFTGFVNSVTSSTAWNYGIGYYLGLAQGIVNDLDVLGNSIIGLANLSTMTTPQYWVGRAFGISLTIPPIPSARGIITSEPDWEYNTSQIFADFGIALVTLEIPLGGSGVMASAERSAIENLGTASQALPRLLTREIAAPIIELLERYNIKVLFEYGGSKNAFKYYDGFIQIVTKLEDTKIGVFFEEVQHALDFLADMPGFLQDMAKLNAAKDWQVANWFYHVGVFERMSANPLFQLNDAEADEIWKAAQWLLKLAGGG